MNNFPLQGENLLHYLRYMNAIILSTVRVQPLSTSTSLLSATRRNTMGSIFSQVSSQVSGRQSRASAITGRSITTMVSSEFGNTLKLMGLLAIFIILPIAAMIFFYVFKSVNTIIDEHDDLSNANNNNVSEIYWSL